jgi:hypothetical protein
MVKPHMGADGVEMLENTGRLADVIANPPTHVVKNTASNRHFFIRR